MLTASARLARDLRAQFDQQQLSSGAQTWQSADVLPWESWLARTWGLFCAARFDAPIVLNAQQCQAAWHAIIQDDINRHHGDDAPLWNVRATAAHAMQARQVCAEWRIALSDCEQSPHYDHQSWVRWALRFAKVCKKNNWIDSHDIAERLIALLKSKQASELLGHMHSVSSRNAHNDARTPLIELHGFDSLTPRQETLVKALTNADAQVAVHPPAQSQGATTARVHCSKTPDDEWRAAARFARDKLDADPNARIAVVAPNLAACADAIEYALAEQLCPQHLSRPRIRAQLPWHLSLVNKLARHPLVADAQLLLAPFGGDGWSLEQIERLLRSPFIVGATDEMQMREKLAGWCRRKLPPQIALDALYRRWQTAKSAPACPQLMCALKKSLPMLNKATQRKTADEWARRFDKWLKIFGWPATAQLNSDEYQTVRAFDEQLQCLASMELTAAPMPALEALSWLAQQLDESVFQTQAHDAPVQVLGVQAAAGQQFDALWFGNLTEDHWPPPPRPNPFIAVGLQREVGVAQASPIGARQLAEVMHNRLLACADEVVLSWAKPQDDSPPAPSVLLPAHGDEQPLCEVNSPARVIYQSDDSLQSFDDAPAPLSASDEAGGGASLIENQSKCPFRAFAIHRLRARIDDAGQRGLSALERGSLIHHALEFVWGELGDSKTLHNIGKQQLDELIGKAAVDATKEYAFKNGCGKRFAVIQRQWVAETLGEWLAYEKEREQSFEVLAREEDAELLFGGLRLRFRIDRIDRLADGKIAVMDYKTGRVASLSAWVGERPRSPQLPLYALAQKEPVGMLAFAQVKKGECKFSGVYAAQFNAHGAMQAFDTFEELRAHWRQALPALAQEYVDGVADVTPQKNVCQMCNLHTLCRNHAGVSGFGAADAADNNAAETVDERG